MGPNLRVKREIVLRGDEAKVGRGKHCSLYLHKSFALVAVLTLR